MPPASDAAPPAERADETLLALAPRPSVVRSAVLAVVVATLLTCAYVAPDFLRPVVVSGQVGSEVLTLSDSVLVTTDLALTSRGDIQVVGVEPAPGARLVGAWLLPPAEVERMHTAPDLEVRDALDTLEARYQGEVPLAELRLPQALVAGTTQHLVLLWEITDCAALLPGFVPELTVRTAVGATEHLPLGPYVGPAPTPEWLVELGVCDVVSTSWSSDR